MPAGCKARVGLNNSLDGRKEESKGLARTGSGLGDAVERVGVRIRKRCWDETRFSQRLHLHILPLQGWVNAHRLNICHVLISHVIGDGADDAFVDAERSKIRKAGDITRRLTCSILARSRGRGARVAPRDDLTAYRGCQSGRPVC